MSHRVPSIGAHREHGGNGEHDGQKGGSPRARESALCGQWSLLDREHHETGSVLARLCTGSAGTRLGAVGGIKRLAGDKVCENSVLHSWTPFLVGNSQRRFPLPLYALTMYHRVPMSGKAVGHGGPVFWPRCQKAVWDKGARYFTRGLQPGTPGHPGSPRYTGTFRSTPSGNMGTGGDRRGQEGTGVPRFFQIKYRITENHFSFSKKAFFRKKFTR